MAMRVHHHHIWCSPRTSPSSSSSSCPLLGAAFLRPLAFTSQRWRLTTPVKRRSSRGRRPSSTISASSLDLTEDNVRLVLEEARIELAQIFDASVGITGVVDLAELDGPFVKLRFKGRFWHKRSTVLARLDNYLKNRIPEILEVDIEDENQLDDSPASF